MSPGARAEGFTPAFFAFLRELNRNNNRPWFLDNKPRFERDVLGPSLAFVDAIRPGIHRISPHLVADARPVGGSLMRIYRDVRFSKDKRPYRTSMGIHLFHEASKAHEGGLPGFFLHLAPSESFLASGVWRPAPVDLLKIRQGIVKRPAEWKRVRGAGLAEDEDSLKRVPPRFDSDHPMADDLRRKSFVASTDLKDAQIIAPGFSRRLVADCHRLDGLNRFLAAAVGVDY